MNKVSIATKPLVYSTFRYISNHVWHAIGEYVDNSIQSFLDHQDVLKKINTNHKLTVSINFKFEDDTIIIRDNAYGIESSKFDKAFELANIPLDASGLNEFGMGMKVSSIWLSNRWEVETSAYGEPVKRIVTFDLDEVVANEETELNVIEKPCSPDIHYTIITLKQLSHNKPTGRQIGAIKKHLASIYTKFIREGVLELQVDDAVIEDTILKPLKAPYWKTPNEKPIVWKKDINFVAGPYKVKGFIGILEKMSTNTDNGFLLFRRNKVIGTSYDTKYRPKKLCGEVGSPRYKRIYGELELEGFSVSFTKNSFTQDDELDAFIEALAIDLQRDDSLKIFDQAQKYTSTKTKVEKKNIANQFINSIASGLDKPIVIAKPVIAPPKDLFANSSETVSISTPKPQIETKMSKVTVGGETFYLSIGAEEKLEQDPFYNIVSEKENHYRSVINLKHKFFERFSSLVDKEEDIEPISTIIRAMIITEILMSKEDAKESYAFRTKFNEIFGSL